MISIKNISIFFLTFLTFLILVGCSEYDDFEEPQYIVASSESYAELINDEISELDSFENIEKELSDNTAISAIAFSDSAFDVSDTDSLIEEIPESLIEDEVWVSKSGKKYHAKSGCSGMKNPSGLSKNDAVASGYEACKKCYN